ncbi:hypothetical protein JAAARDRAFT_200614 [Jaapia argillacea MUCL 33604]|uniref:Cytochrome P450 n=1 Tax=Jaapia argillacea MUCL 33604 TaxID=933084 RepID=A0A067P4J0_9AGAM|nr:hypothetical protein JAAARDRAFT_200614 [Jaapia argillacea MUCL 33604]
MGLEPPVYAFAFFVIVLLLSRLTRANQKYLPGPPGLPLVGNTFQVPPHQQWVYFKSLSDKFGPIVRLVVGTDDVVVINRGAEADELLGKRSAIYSDRPISIYAGKYQSQNRRIGLLKYGTELKRQRTAFHGMLQPRVVGAYEVYQDQASLKLLSDMLTHPDQPFLNAQRFSASLIYRLTYGLQLEDGSKDLEDVLKVIDDFVAEVAPGRHLVDGWPFLDWFPDFLAPWRRDALRTHENEFKLYGRLVREVKQRMESGDSHECFISRLWEQQHKLDLDEMAIAYLGGSSFEAGTGTTSDSLLWLFAATLLYPEPVKAAQRELDSIVGDDHIPGFDDFKALPYSVALTREVFRWAPLVPTCLPHALEKDDVYQGYLIKGGSTVIPNVWGMHHDEETFPRHHVFDPTRYLTEGVPTFELLSEGHWLFGFGRRLCPGRHLGAKSVWIALTRLIWAYDILPVFDEAGQPILPDLTKCTTGITCKPDEFPVRIVPRSEKRVEMITSAFDDSLAKDR